MLREAQATDIQKQVRIQPKQCLKWDERFRGNALASSCRPACAKQCSARLVTLCVLGTHAGSVVC